MIIILIAILILFSALTDTGITDIKQTKNLFILEEEKKIVQSIEGSKEDITVVLQEGNNAEYVIYIDEERYKFVKGENSDLITTKEPLEEKYPEVSMEIKQYNKISPKEMVAIIEEEIATKYTTVTETESITEPIIGYKLHGISGSEWNSPVINIYVVDNHLEGSFVITEKYFLEAAEGHGARFYAMVQQFKIKE